VYQLLAHRLRAALAQHIQQTYALELPIALERPPKIELGEASSPISFELAKRLKRAPRQIAQEIANTLAAIPGIAKIEVAGAGYLNAYFDRSTFWEAARKEAAASAEAASTSHSSGKIIVEHTSINPNKAAHIGHVRNAVLGDTMARTLRYAGNNVQVQNYIDNTGVQVADVVIGFLHMEKKSVAEIRALATQPKFDHLCWDIYARATQFFAENKERAAKLRGDTLKAIEEGRGEEGEAGQVVADAIVTCHLQTMARLGIFYELLARESEILHLHFWDVAFAKLKESGAIHFVEQGKMAGCWVMPWTEDQPSNAIKDTASSAEDEEKTEEDDNEQDKIIVRSNGTVTYVGKDIAYLLWKFGLLGKDFNYQEWSDAPEQHIVWATTTAPSDTAAPHFGEPAEIAYTVIDVGQGYVQEVVVKGLERLGHAQQAEHAIHFSYERVVLTPKCAAEMGYELTLDEQKKPYVQVSGRKGLGVKADDLIDRLETAAETNVLQRHAGISADECKQIAHAIAIGALRYFLLKFTRTSIIAFDFNDALSFEGDTGPYCQYAVVRIRGIRRKGVEAGATTIEVTAESVNKILDGADGNKLWELLVLAGSLDYAVDAVIAAQEPAFLAKYCFNLAQAFNLFYHQHHILSEADEQKRAFLLRLTELVEAQLVRALSLLGITAPEKM
jgi:arginyl-tRNA synthetase